MSELKMFTFDVNVYIDTSTPLGTLFAARSEERQRIVAQGVLRQQLERGNGDSVACRMAISGEDPQFPSNPESIPA